MLALQQSCRPSRLLSVLEGWTACVRVKSERPPPNTILALRNSHDSLSLYVTDAEIAVTGQNSPAKVIQRRRAGYVHGRDARDFQASGNLDVRGPGAPVQETGRNQQEGECQRLRFVRLHVVCPLALDG